MKIAIPLVLVALFACASPAWDGNPSKCFYVERGACFVMDGGALSQGDALRAIDVGAAVFGGAPETIHGYLVIVKGADFRGACGYAGAMGCHDGARLLIVTGGACPASVLAHELGHAAIDDPEHQSPSWRDARLTEGCASKPPSGEAFPAPGR